MSKVRGLYLRGETYWMSTQKDKVRRFVSLETKDLQEAIERMSEMRERPELNDSHTTRAAIPRFLDYRKREHEYSESTSRSKRYVLESFADFIGEIAPAEVTTQAVQKFYDQRRKEVSVSTANGNVMAVRAFFRWALKIGIARRNPCVNVKLARFTQSGRKEFCSAKLRDKLIAECTREDLRFVLFCGFHAGLRFNEIVEARPFWFDLKAGLLHLRKTPTMQFKDREERTIMLRPEVTHGKSIYRYDFGLPFDTYMKTQKCEWVTPHTMRHTFASLLASAGVSIYKIAVWLGDDVRVVQRHYAKLSPLDRDIDLAF
jgi:integrase